MKTINGNNEINTVRAAFIETLSDEFTASTGFGVYAFMAPFDINRLFKQYLHQSSPIRPFAKRYVRSHMLGTPV